MPNVSYLKEIRRFAPPQSHIDEFKVSDAVPGLVCQALEAVQADGASNRSKFGIGALLRFVIARVQAADLDRVFAFDVGKVILPGVKILLILPGRNRPLAGKSAAIYPYGWTINAVGLVRQREECRKI